MGSALMPSAMTRVTTAKYEKRIVAVKYFSLLVAGKTLTAIDFVRTFLHCRFSDGSGHEKKRDDFGGEGAERDHFPLHFNHCMHKWMILLCFTLLPFFVTGKARPA